MAIRIAINGYGRIGRNIMRALYEGQHREHLSIVAVNDLGDAKANALLTEYDSVHGRFRHPVTANETSMQIDGDDIIVLKESDPAKLPWADLDIDIVFECTGRFTSRDSAAIHLKKC